MPKSVLIAEDEKVLRESLAQLLTEEGYDVTMAADGQEAYDLAVNRSFDIVLTDIRMPRMDGAALLQHLQQHRLQLRMKVCLRFLDDEAAVAGFGILGQLA